MDFRKLIEFLVRENLPLNSVTFKANWMEHWYVPQKVDKRYGRLICNSPTRTGLAEWDWGSGSRLGPHKILETEIVRGSRRSILPRNEPKVVIYLERSRQ